MPQSHLAVSSDTAAVAAVSPIGSDAAASTNAQTMSSNSKKKNKTSDHAVAGSLAGMISKTVLQPLDLIKTRMQVQNSDSAVRYRGVGHAIKSVYAEGGVRAFYQGFAPNLLGSAISWGVYFYTYNSVKRYFQTHPRALPFLPSAEAASNGNDGLTPVHHFLSGGVAGVVAVLISNPIWMIKTRIQLQSAGGQAKIYNGISHALRTIVKEEGWKALYRGLAPALTLVSNGALQFMAYEHLRKVVVSRLPNHENDIGPQHFLALGAAAKVVSCTAVYPLQVVKSRLYQRATPGVAHALNPGAANHRVGARYNSMRDVIRHVHQTDGVRGFYKGLVPQLMKVAPASAITFLSYETIVKFLRGKEIYQDVERTAQRTIAQLSSLTKAQAQTPAAPEKPSHPPQAEGHKDPKRTL